MNKKSKLLLEKCKEIIYSMGRDETVRDAYSALTKLYEKELATRLKKGTLVKVDFDPFHMAWSKYKGDAVVVDFPRDQTEWTCDGNDEPHYECDLMENGKVTQKGRFFPASAIKPIRKIAKKTVS